MAENFRFGTYTETKHPILKLRSKFRTISAEILHFSRNPPFCPKWAETNKTLKSRFPSLFLPFPSFDLNPNSFSSISEQPPRLSLSDQPLLSLLRAALLSLLSPMSCVATASCNAAASCDFTLSSIPLLSPAALRACNASPPALRRDSDLLYPSPLSAALQSLRLAPLSLLS